ncbi:MAG: secretion system protein, partial [Kribbellaceae bacterium]|nr:secretion system protein [Kribbellaceae bacterium]
GVAIYLDPVALSAAGGRGPVESLEKAAEVGTGGVFDAIRDALTRASLQQRPPWDELRALGAQLRVPALGDLGEIIAASGGRGAQVYHTLRAKTSSLRDEIRFDDLGDAKKGSTALDAIGAGVVLILLLLVIYPFISRLHAG